MTRSQARRLTERRKSPTCADRMEASGGEVSGRRVCAEEECEDWSSPARYWRTFLAAPLGLAAALSTSASVPTDSGRATAAVEYLWTAQWRRFARRSMRDGRLRDRDRGRGYDPAKLKTCAQTATALGFLATCVGCGGGRRGKTGKTVSGGRRRRAGIRPIRQGAICSHDLLRFITRPADLTATGRRSDSRSRFLRRGGRRLRAGAASRELKALQEPTAAGATGRPRRAAGQGTRTQRDRAHGHWTRRGPLGRRAGRRIPHQQLRGDSISELVVVRVRQADRTRMPSFSRRW